MIAISSGAEEPNTSLTSLSNLAAIFERHHCDPFYFDGGRMKLIRLQYGSSTFGRGWVICLCMGLRRMIYLKEQGTPHSNNFSDGGLFAAQGTRDHWFIDFRVILGNENMQ